MPVSALFGSALFDSALFGTARPLVWYALRFSMNPIFDESGLQLFSRAGTAFPFLIASARRSRPPCARFSEYSKEGATARRPSLLLCHVPLSYEY